MQLKKIENFVFIAVHYIWIVQLKKNKFIKNDIKQD